VIYQKRNYLEEAEEEFRKASDLEPANETFMENLTLVKDDLKKKAKAKTQKMQFGS
jgi:Flp pilus assembly protein TadD